MKEKNLESGGFETGHENSEIPSGWQDLAEKADDFDEERARRFREEAIKDQKYEEMKDGIEQGLNEYANTMIEIEGIKQDPQALQEMQYGYYYSIENKKERFQQERIQEIVEKDLNQRLTKVEDIASKAEIGGLGVTKTMTEYNGEPITIYNMQGAPLKMLTSSISYKDTAVEKGGPDMTGGMTMKALEVQPAIWMENEQRMDEHNRAAVQRGFGRSAKRGNTLSCSYTDVHKNPDRRLGTSLDKMSSHSSEPYIVYGWDHVRPGSVMEVGDTDLNTPQIVDKRGYLRLRSLNVWDKLENGTMESKGSYDEVAMKRYDESGEAKPPDYLVIENGQISEAIKHHAAAFNVPILNVERKYYDKDDSNKDKVE